MRQAVLGPHENFSSYKINELPIARQDGAPSRFAQATAAPKRRSGFRHWRGGSCANQRHGKGIVRTEAKNRTRLRSARATGDSRLRALTEHALEIITVQDAAGA